jgi:hypothetical protein
MSSSEEVGWEMAVMPGPVVGAVLSTSIRVVSSGDGVGCPADVVEMGVVMYTLLLVLTCRTAHTLSFVQRWRYSSLAFVA